jgi:hypothetical protein
LDLPSIARQLWEGLTGNTTFSWVGAVVFAVCELVLCTVVFRPRRFVAIDPHYLMDGKGDEYLILSWRLAAIRFKKSSRPEVVYMGASQATRALVTRNAAELSEEISEAAGLPVDFFPASSNGQRFEEALAITDQLQDGFRGVIVLMVNDYKSDYHANRSPADVARARSRIAAVSAPSLQPFWEASGYRPLHTGVFFLDHLGFFAARRAAAVRLGPVKGDPGLGAFSDVRFHDGIVKLDHERRDLEEDRESAARRKQDAKAPLLTRSRKVLVRLLSNMEQLHAPVVLLENPELPTRNEVYAARVERFRTEIRELAEQYGARYWDFNPELDLSDRDFQDTVHLGSAMARRRFQDLLMSRLGELIADRFSESGGFGGARADGTIAAD